MKIASVAVSYPERVVTNAEILEGIQRHSAPTMPPAELRKLLSAIDLFFRYSGTRERRWRAPGERARDHALKAAREAMERAGVGPGDIDLLIYVGVGRGWLEPGMSHLFLAELGIEGATCFDVLDACLSWLRALQIAHQMIRAGVHKRVLVISAEFNVDEYMDMSFTDLSQLSYRFPGMTIGEAASATVLEAGETEIEPHFEFHTRPDLHNLCKIPLKNIEQFSGSERCPDLRPLTFFSYGQELFEVAMEWIPSLYKQSKVLQERRVDLALSHQASRTLVERIDQANGLTGKTVMVYEKLGNTVSSSVPCCMAQALEDGRLTRGKHVLIGVGSAGFTVGFGHLSY